MSIRSKLEEIKEFVENKLQELDQEAEKLVPLAEKIIPAVEAVLKPCTHFLANCQICNPPAPPAA